MRFFVVNLLLKMKIINVVLFFFIVSVNKIVPAGYTNHQIPAADSIPARLLGNFMDDYGIKYSIQDSLWIQHPSATYHIIKWNTKEQYIIARNGEKNHADKGFYTRIDYMYFDNMEPFIWGFCLTVYDAKSDSIAEAAAHADRQNPKKGCNGFPFSRMKRVK
jgi:hypothetical protein